MQTISLRGYQRQTVASVLECLRDGEPTCLVAPTGAGKTVMGAAIAARYERPLWMTHRRELADQAPCRAVTVQSGARPDCDLLIYDECHVAGAVQWGDAIRSYVRAGVPVVGLTATPQRADGVPLGDTFTRLVVACQYSQLLSDGVLVPVRVFAPPRSADLAGGLAMSPEDAWAKYACGRRGLIYVDTMAEAERVATAVGGAAITGDTPSAVRASRIAAFRDGVIGCLVNVHTLTEGLDVPEASIAVLARGCQHVGTYLQIAGRVLRAAPGKADALLIDLSGSSLAHGSPTDDRAYSLDGSGIARGGSLAVAQCMACGAVYPPQPVCPECGHVQDRKGKPIRDVELREAYAAGDDCYAILRATGRSPEWVQRRYRELTGERIFIRDATHTERSAFIARMQAIARAKRFKPGYVAVRYKELFGSWPSKSRA